MATVQENLFVDLVDAPLVTEDYVAKVKDAAAGAIATFSGCTRDSFEGKQVVKLEYEAYKPMAQKTMQVARLFTHSSHLTLPSCQELCTAALNKWNICKIAIAHALGIVEVGQVSVVVAVSSAHRREALEVRMSSKPSTACPCALPGVSLGD